MKRIARKGKAEQEKNNISGNITILAGHKDHPDSEYAVEAIKKIGKKT